MGKRSLWGFLAAAVMLVSVVSAHAEDPKCTLAYDIQKKAVEKFKADKAEGLKLFKMAHEYCPEDPRLAFSLGLAYFRYGNPKEAETYVKKAVEKDRGNPDWLNLLAWLMLETGSDRAKALSHARDAARQRPEAPAVADTLVRALSENGQLYEALAEGTKALKKWPKDQRIAERYAGAKEAYMGYYLKKTEAGAHDEAIQGLKKADLDPDLVNAYCWALFAAGRVNEALAEARKGKEKFPRAEALIGTFDQVMDRFIQARFGEFRQGKRPETYESLKKMSDLYPDHRPLKDACEKVIAAVMADARDIPVPPPMKIPEAGKAGGGEGGRILAGIQKAGGAREVEKDLLVDVDKDIPKGKEQRPHAVAVIIGNRDYSRSGHGVPDVDFALRDAGFIRRYVQDVLGYSEANVIHKENVSLADLLRIFGTRDDPKGQLHNFHQSRKGNQADIFIYYAGHGAPDQEGKGAYLLPVDANTDYISTNGYPLATLYDNLAGIPARRVVLVLDACFSGNSAGGPLLKNVSPGMLRSADPVRKLQNGVVFTSAGKDQVSCWYPQQRHSLFTYFFMKGLKGEADANKDGRITVAEMKSYLSENVRPIAMRLGNREQDPIIVGEESWEMVRFK